MDELEKRRYKVAMNIKFGKFSDTDSLVSDVRLEGLGSQDNLGGHSGGAAFVAEPFYCGGRTATVECATLEGDEGFGRQEAAALRELGVDLGADSEHSVDTCSSYPFSKEQATADLTAPVLSMAEYRQRMLDKDRSK